MKRYIYLLLAILIITSLLGCSSKQITEGSNKDKLYSAELTDAEKNILKLVGVQSNINIFNFEVNENYQTVSLWLETYQNGELIAIDSRMKSKIESMKGKIAVIVDKTANYTWKVSLQGEGNISSYSFATKGEFETNGEFSVSSGSLNQEVEILPEKEIVLCTYLFEDGNSVSVYDNQLYVEQPELVQEYDYVYLLKCRFSQKTIEEINTSQVQT